MSLSINRMRSRKIHPSTSSMRNDYGNISDIPLRNTTTATPEEVSPAPTGD